VTTRFNEALEELYGRERHKDKLGLEGTRALLAALGDPHRRFRSVHVAGTNGKGSVCAMVERVLREAGCRTGLFTSPHLVDFRERIRVNGRWVDADWLERMLERIASLPEGKDRTFFEVCTALGFAYFAEQQVEWAVVEVGLGGRLDCTNVLEPDVTVITSIGLDHTEILGNTIEQIAREKAGIIKPGVPVIENTTGAAERVVKQIAAEQGAPTGDELHWNLAVPAGEEGPEDLATTILAPRSSFQDFLRKQLRSSPWGPFAEPPNTTPYRWFKHHGIVVQTVAELVARGLPVSWEAVRRGLAHARWPGRMERCPSEPRLWWDGAHNVPAAIQLDASWREQTGTRKPAVLVTSFSRDKDVAGFFRVIGWHFAGSRIVAARSRNERSMDPAIVANHARAFGFEVAESTDVPTAVRRGLQMAGEGSVLLTGSLFAVGEAMEAFGGAPGEQL
jgi:dihydrofolate synthase/folylpolyglutamate synthase